ncbi:YceI family protein [Pelistega sp. MC2]|uniref:YceI family protein n=1 Tax=Pelistega sp. MC2 TaxID=1720297 RepID=UPI0008D90E84|nr:YceI family protein [Pelistega sp. MC2]
MKLFSTLSLSILVATAKPAIAAEYEFDPAHTNVFFTIDHFGTSTNHGAFHGIEGVVEVDRAAKTGNVSVAVPLSKLSTGNSGFDGHLKSADLFNAEKFPEITFKSNEWEFDGDKVKSIKGDLTLLGKTQPVVFEATKFNCYDSPKLKKEVCGGDFKTTLDRHQFGMDFLKGAITPTVEVTLQVEAVKK